MTQKTYMKTILIIALVCISVAGFWIHAIVHPIGDKEANAIPFIAGLVSIFVISVFFFFRRLVPIAYLENGMLAILGMITMTYFSIIHFPVPFDMANLLDKTLLPDVVILVTVFIIGKVLFERQVTNVNNLDSPRHKGRFFRYPNMGYWVAHLVAFSVVCTLGYMLWK
ncbi:MAG TPA: hypothetical protein VF857_05425 [Spirochaetota bacterium]